MLNNFTRVTLAIFCLLLSFTSFAQEHSVARQWNEVLLDAIRKDYARPTVHARNLFHSSVLMYDAWAVFDDKAKTYFLGNELNGFSIPFDGINTPIDVEQARETVLSFAVYRLLSHRFANSPGQTISQLAFDKLFQDLGHDANFVSIDYSKDSYEALGNYLGQKMIEYGLQDHSNEQNNYKNTYYTATNDALLPVVQGNPKIKDPNRWQPLSLDTYVDQSGNTLPNSIPEFLGPEWGNVYPFALTEEDLSVFTRDNNEFKVYHDPGEPSRLDVPSERRDYQWGFELVSIWSAQLDPNDGVMWDISPKSMGNVEVLPETIEELKAFYDSIDGGDPGVGYAINPKTNLPYEEQLVPRGDYTRVLAEFWADGPDSETPPGHWFTILNYVSDHDDFVRKMEGEGEILSPLEWDIKSYFTLGGAVHDASVTAWGIKGWYDYIRPISAIRYMCDLGQCSDSTLSNYNVLGIDLKPGFIEIVEEGDPLASSGNVGKIKVKAWKGPDYIQNPDTDVAGVDWILAENWWPYQRPSFVTPPFAGYVSGHSVFSRAAAEVLTSLTGDAYFPGGMGEFVAKQNEFLVFEEGPSVDVVLQWATYRDASDQTSLSRIWGGIHPPVDDVPGRIIGEKIGVDAFRYAKDYFNPETAVLANNALNNEMLNVYPNPVRKGETLTLQIPTPIDNDFQVLLTTLFGESVELEWELHQNELQLRTQKWGKGIYILSLESSKGKYQQKVICED